MKVRTMMVMAAMLAVVAACSEGPERGEAADEVTAEAVENEAMEASEAAEAAEADEADEADEANEADEAAQAGAIELPADLLARAKVSVEAARAAALARVPGGTIKAGELEEEDGALIFSFDIAVEGMEGIEEVHVDALTGEVLAQEHEGAAEEADEADEEGGR